LCIACDCAFGANGSSLFALVCSKSSFGAFSELPAREGLRLCRWRVVYLLRAIRHIRLPHESHAV
jgi:hypothetical protein